MKVKTKKLSKKERRQLEDCHFKFHFYKAIWPFNTACLVKFLQNKRIVQRRKRQERGSRVKKKYRKGPEGIKPLAKELL